MPKDSAALCLIVEDSLFFIKRGEDVPTHKGQIAFVGGHMKANETDSKETIKREFLEETSIDASYIEFKTSLPESFTRGKKKIFPWVAESKLNKKDFQAQLKSNEEWDQYYLVPIKDLKEKKLWQRSSFHKDVYQYEVLFFPFIGTEVISNRSMAQVPILWGATARMVWNFINL